MRHTFEQLTQEATRKGFNLRRTPAGRYALHYPKDRDLPGAPAGSCYTLHTLAAVAKELDRA